MKATEKHFDFWNTFTSILDINILHQILTYYLLVVVLINEKLGIYNKENDSVYNFRWFPIAFSADLSKKETTFLFMSYYGISKTTMSKQ